MDCNFPASECTTHTTSKKKIELSCDLPTALDAICEVLPLDFFIESPVSYMCPQEGVALPPAGKEVTDAFKAAIDKHCPGVKQTPVERFSFYDEVRTAFAVVQVLERRPYGNVVLTKGWLGQTARTSSQSRAARRRRSKRQSRVEIVIFISPQNVPTLHTGLRALYELDIRTKCYTLLRTVPEAEPIIHVAASLPLSRIPGHSITHKVGGSQAGTRCHTPLTAASAISTRR